MSIKPYIIGTVLLCLLSACATGSNGNPLLFVQEDATEENVSGELDQSTGDEESKDKVDVDDLEPGLQACVDVLENRLMFFSTLADAEIFFSEYLDRYCPFVSVADMEMAYVDMDGDGAREIVLVLPGVEDREILRYENGVVYGYNFGIRSMMNLKTDGTFAWANSAFDTGYGMLRFDGTHCDMVELARQQLHGDSDAEFMIDGRNVAEDEYDLYCRQQENKEDVIYKSPPHIMDGDL